MTCKKVCATCDFWHIGDVALGVHTAGLAEAECRASPPLSGVTDNGVTTSTWPLTFEKDWCGGWKEREPYRYGHSITLHKFETVQGWQDSCVEEFLSGEKKDPMRDQA